MQEHIQEKKILIFNFVIQKHYFAQFISAI